MNCSQHKISRRTFMAKSVKLSVSTCITCALPTLFVGCSNKYHVSPGNYYVSQKSKLLKDFDDTFNPGRSILVASMDETFADQILKEARIEYEAIIPKIPYIGGEENTSTQHIVGASQCLAIYKTLKEKGMDIKEIGKIIYDMTEAYIHVQPKWVLNIYGYFKYHLGRSDKMREQAKMSQKRQYPMDFVFKFVEGDGKELDYGTDMIECGIVKFFRTQSAEELVPYICVLDFPISKAFNRGLIRTMTIAEGAEICDFRYKKGRITQEILPPGFKKI